MIPNPFPRVLLIFFFLATLSLAFNPGSKRGHLNRRGEGKSATPLQPVGPSSSSPFIPSPPPSTDVSSSLRHTLNPPSDLSTGFRRSSSLPNNFAPLSSYKPALDTSEWSAGSPAPSSHGSDGAFGPYSYPSVSTSPSDSPRRGSGRAKLADFLSPNIRGEQPLPADVPETSTSHTLPPSTANAAEEAGKGKNTALVAKPLKGGALDKYLGDSANSHIEEAISKLPQAEGAYQLVSFPDPTAPGGAQVYRYYNRPNHDVYRERVDYVPPVLHDAKKAEAEIKEYNIRGEQPLPADVPETSTSRTLPPSTANAAEEAGKGKNTALVAKPLDGGVLDKYLRNPANSHIKEAISKLSQAEGAYQLVSFPDPTAPGGAQVYRFYNRPNHGVYRERVDYVPRILHDVRNVDAELQETLLSYDKKTLKKKTGWTRSGIPEFPEEEYAKKFSSAPASSSGFAKVEDSTSSRFAPVQEKMRIHLVNLKDHIAKAKNPELANYYTTGGKPAIYGFEQYGLGKTIPHEARVIAQKFGEARVFYDPKNYKDQVRLVYTGPSPGGSTASSEMFRTYLVPEDKALPLPKALRQLDLRETMSLFKHVDEGTFYRHVPERSPTSLRTKVSQWPTSLRTKVSQWPTSLRTKVSQWPTSLRTKVSQWPTSLRTKVSQWPTRLRTKVSQWPTSLRTKATWWTAMARPVGPNQQQMDHHPVAGRWNTLGDRVGSAWGRMKTVSSKIPESMRGLFKNPPVSGARELVRPIRR
ncbi:uncharacterized protein UDID_17951 [Ustilago sp. UG-2017a]|nr:uncharacterized protein UDID_17951 [Ustilago sp. UG-2017a]